MSFWLYFAEKSVSQTKEYRLALRAVVQYAIKMVILDQKNILLNQASVKQPQIKSYLRSGSLILNRFKLG